MRFRFSPSRRVTQTLRDLARRRPDEAETYLEEHQDEWELLAETVPEDAADLLEALDEEGAAELLTGLPPDDAGEVLDEMKPEAAADVLEELDPATAAHLVEEMEPDQAADVIDALERDEREAVLAHLDPEGAAAALRGAPGVELVTGSAPGTRDAAGCESVRVARLRADPSRPRGLAFWLTADALRALADEGMPDAVSKVKEGQRAFYTAAASVNGRILGPLTFTPQFVSLDIHQSSRALSVAVILSFETSGIHFTLSISSRAFSFKFARPMNH